MTWEHGPFIGMPMYAHDRMVVGVPAYNEERHIRATLQSIVDQDWPSFLVLMSDNGSTDRTTEICREFAEADARFHYVRHPVNKGAIFNFNFVLDNSRSPYFMWLGAHDMIGSSFLREHIGALDMLPDHSLSYSDTQWIDEDGASLRVTKASSLGFLKGDGVARYLQSAHQIRECTAVNNVIRREMIGKLRLSNIPGCDHVFLSNLLFRGPANNIREPLYMRRELSGERHDYMQRMTGQAGLARDMPSLAKLYVSHFRSLPVPLMRKFKAELKLRRIVARRFDPASRTAKLDDFWRRIRQGAN